jgi:hypothetical protein
MKVITALLFLFSTSIIYSQTKFKNVESIVGVEYSELEREIYFDNFTLTNTGGGYLLPKDENFNDFSINYCHSETSIFFLFIKHHYVNGKKLKTVKDVLEIKKSGIGKKQKITEYCQTKNGVDSEIFAIVKEDSNPEFYTKIIRAWRANRKTERFEKIKPRKIVKCGNESYGI